MAPPAASAITKTMRAKLLARGSGKGQAEGANFSAQMCVVPFPHLEIISLNWLHFLRACAKEAEVEPSAFSLVWSVNPSILRLLQNP